MSEKRSIVPYFLIGGGVLVSAAAAIAAYYFREQIVDLVIPTKTGKKRVDEILGKLQAAASASGIPLGLLVGWVIKESGGK